MKARFAISLAAGNGVVAVILGAFGAHALKIRLEPSMMAVYETAVHYHFYHLIGLLLAGVMLTKKPDYRWLELSAWSFILGIVLFCGSLYFLAVTGVKSFGLLTPFGGVALIGGWGFLTVAAIKIRW